MVSRRDLCCGCYGGLFRGRRKDTLSLSVSMPTQWAITVIEKERNSIQPDAKLEVIASPEQTT